MAWTQTRLSRLSWALVPAALLASGACSKKKPAASAGGAGPVAQAGQASAAGAPSEGGGGAAGPSAQSGSANQAGSPDAPEPAVFPDCMHPEVRADCAGGWCKLPAGCFVMGSPPGEFGRGVGLGETEVPVTLSHGFEMRQHELTQAEWKAAGFVDPSSTAAYGRDCAGDDCPVGTVNWYEAAAYANALSRAHSPALEACYILDACSGEVGSGMTCTASQATPSVYDCKGYRLPTHAEWEYAARAGTRGAFYSGNITVTSAPDGTCEADPALERIAWYCHNSAKTTHAVGQKEPNGFGLFDMLGNAAEWHHGKSPVPRPEGPQTDPVGVLPAGEVRQLSTCGFTGWSRACRVAFRLDGSTMGRGPGVGVRLVRTL